MIHCQSAPVSHEISDQLELHKLMSVQTTKWYAQTQTGEAGKAVAVGILILLQ